MSNFTVYLNEKCLSAEEGVYKLVKEALNGETKLSPTLDWKRVEQILPTRVQLIKEKGGALLEGSSGWDQVGIDLFFQWEGKSFAIDITTGSSTVVKNKKKKMLELAPLLEDYILVVLVLRKGEITQDQWDDFLLEASNFSPGEIVDFRIV